MRKAQGFHARLTFSLLSGLLAAAPLHAGDEVKLNAAQAQAMGVETVSLAASTAPTGKALPARVAIPNNQLQVVSAPVAGLIETMAAAPGQAVKKGQVLARLQSPGVVEIQRGFLQAATQAQLARESLARDEKLFKEGIIAESRHLAAKSREIEASAALFERRQALRLAGLSEAAIRRLENDRSLSSGIEIVAPLDGVVLEQMAVAGQRAEAAAPLYKVARLAPLWLEIQAPIAQVAHVQAGVDISVPAYQAKGKVVYVGRGVEEGSQTVTVRAEVRQGAENLRPGQFVEAVLATDGNGKHWHVPNAVLVRLRDQSYVFVQTSTGFRAKAVKLEGEAAGSSIITGDLKGDERIALRGTASLKAMWQGLAAGGE